MSTKLASRLGALALMVAVSLTSGCGTIYQAHQQEGPAVFGGLRLDVQEIGHEESTIGDIVFFCIDMPFSLGGDACMLLVSGINEIYALIHDDGIEVYPQRPSTLDSPLYLHYR
jgi:uncharacterized protein YceK